VATFDSKPFSGQALRTPYRRADIELHGVDQVVPSYEGRVFLNNPEADPETPLDATNGYLGSFFIFGKVDCWGKEGHCDEPADRKFDRRRVPTRHAKIRVRTPDGALAQLMDGADDEVTLNLVAVLPDTEEYKRFKPEDALRFERLSIVTYA
jgi:hypothetical protein